MALALGTLPVVLACILSHGAPRGIRRVAACEWGVNSVQSPASFSSHQARGGRPDGLPGTAPAHAEKDAQKRAWAGGVGEGGRTPRPTSLHLAQGPLGLSQEHSTLSSLGQAGHAGPVSRGLYQSTWADPRLCPTSATSAKPLPRCSWPGQGFRDKWGLHTRTGPLVTRHSPRGNATRSE